jgi:hypothetical protein
MGSKCTDELHSPLGRQFEPYTYNCEILRQFYFKPSIFWNVYLIDSVLSTQQQCRRSITFEELDSEGPPHTLSIEWVMCKGPYLFSKISRFIALPQLNLKACFCSVKGCA